MNEEAHKLIHRLAALREPSQRVAIVSEAADELDAETFVDVLALITGSASQAKEGRHQVALSAVTDFLSSPRLRQEQKLAWLTTARDRGHPQVLQLLVSPPPSRTVVQDLRVPDYGAGRSLTLGERKSLARKPNRHTLEKVLTDPHPAVIHNLLRNPRITEQDILRLVSRRPNRQDVLTVVSRHPKWLARYPIKVALVRNPYTPPSIALKLLPLLLRQDLEEISHDMEIHQSVLLAVSRILRGDTPDDDKPKPTLH